MFSCMFSFILMQICLAEKVKYIVSPYESDAQIAYLLSRGHADFALTEDSDLLVFGCKKVRGSCNLWLYYE